MAGVRTTGGLAIDADATRRVELQSLAERLRTISAQREAVERQLTMSRRMALDTRLTKDEHERRAAALSDRLGWAIGQAQRTKA
eukprot:SAG11_NODE_20794_length_438_cov_0.746313_1_plen_83_part_01